MSSRTARTYLVACLLIVGAAGGYLLFDTSQRHSRAFAHEREVLTRLDAMLTAVNDLAVTQRGYFEPGRGASGATTSPQFQRVRQLTDALKEQLGSLRAEIASPEGNEQVASLTSALDDFSTTDTRVRTNLANDTYFSAADLVFSASATELKAATGSLIALKTLTAAEALGQYTSLQRRAALVAAAVGLVWTLGLLLLVLPSSEEKTTLPGDPPQPVENTLQIAEVPTAAMPEPAPPAPTVDLEEAARVCTAIASATSAAELREILADAAATLDASGLIVWLGAGEELFPVLGHGYDPRMLSRIGPIARNTANATAAAWRLGQPQTVDGDDSRPAAMVLPLVSSQGCIGVLSAEVAAGREHDVAVRAVATLIAAQLSVIVAAWPEPSANAPDAPASQTGSIALTL